MRNFASKIIPVMFLVLTILGAAGCGIPNRTLRDVRILGQLADEHSRPLALTRLEGWLADNCSSPDGRSGERYMKWVEEKSSKSLYRVTVGTDRQGRFLMNFKGILRDRTIYLIPPIFNVFACRRINLVLRVPDSSYPLMVLSLDGTVDLYAQLDGEYLRAAQPDAELKNFTHEDSEVNSEKKATFVQFTLALPKSSGEGN